MSKLNGCAQFSDQNFLVCLFGFLFLAGLDPHLMSARRGQRSAAAAVEREFKCIRCHANEAAGSRHSSSGVQGQDQGRAEQRYLVDFHATAKVSSSGRSHCGLHQSELTRISSNLGTCKFSSSSRREESETAAVQHHR